MSNPCKTYKNIFTNKDSDAYKEYYRRKHPRTKDYQNSIANPMVKVSLLNKGSF